MSFCVFPGGCPCPLQCQLGGCYGNRLANQATYGGPPAGISPLLAGGLAGTYNAQAAAQAQVSQYLSLPQSPSPPKEPLERAGIVVGELLGWRIWGVRYGYLTSYSYDTAWVPDEPMTGAPGDYDSAGVWAFKRRRYALKKMLDSGSNYAYGSVALWGEVVEHDLGYRAEFARVLTIEDWIPGYPELHEKPYWFRRSRRIDRLAELRAKYCRSPPAPDDPDPTGER